MNTFKWTEPKSLEQAAAFLAGATERAAVMAGGTDLLAEVKEGIESPEVIVDLKAISGLSYIKDEKDGLHIGALTTLAELAADPTVRASFPGLHQAASVVASPQIRNMGTVGGNLCQRPRCWYYRDAETRCRKKGGSLCFAARGRNKYHAILGGGICHIVYPSDLAPMLIALDAKLALVSAKGARAISLADFYALPAANVRRENVLRPGELVREVVVPTPAAGLRSSYQKFMERGSWDFAVVSAAAAAILSGRSVRDMRIVLGGVAPVPWRLEAAEDVLRGKRLDEGTVKRAAAEALKDAKPLEENAYKAGLAAVIAARAVLALTA